MLQFYKMGKWKLVQKFVCQNLCGRFLQLFLEHLKYTIFAAAFAPQNMLPNVKKKPKQNKAMKVVI